ncbi:2-oxo-4-hydroxy-4-carboxy-5-ureidoimidazoline decarboxylase [Ferrovibrio sp.]|uniref:2-oxo-4-hydroxy-4-carboxy-5-ureidoimidazoline decarboxylase n=1 Tax=Ferrovibrio sp. TaxID=1917215 RepID=UPI0025B8A740|nr:2-oxo-4-hydroxy-4-carboxy-5-ureidoimidazoline decarboxylase [Ferrovibrio sp.]
MRLDTPGELTPMQRITALMAELNGLPEAAFVARLGGIIEHSPWAAAEIVALRPFGDLESLHSAMLGAVWRRGRVAQLDLLNAHPELAGKEADAGTLTAHSTSEQDSVGLTSLSPWEKTRITELNQAYRAKHGFPFIIAVKLRNKAQILANFERRLANDTEVELAVALMEVSKIARMRLDALLAA